jgi:hypothetical protein
VNFWVALIPRVDFDSGDFLHEYAIISQRDEDYANMNIIGDASHAAPA